MGVYSDRLKTRGLRHGSGSKGGGGVLGTGKARKGGGGLRHGPGSKGGGGVLGTGQALKGGGLRHGSGSKKGGGLRHGSGKKGGSLPRHIPVLDIYVSAPPPPPGIMSNSVYTMGLVGTTN